MKVYINKITPIREDLTTLGDSEKRLQFMYFSVDYVVYNKGHKLEGTKTFYCKDFTYSSLGESIASDVANILSAT